MKVNVFLFLFYNTMMPSSVWTLVFVCC